LKEWGNLEDPCTDGRTKLNTHLTKPGCESVDLIDLTGNRDKSQAAVDTVMNLPLLYDAGNCLTSWGHVSLWRTMLRRFSYVKVKLTMSALCRHTGTRLVQLHSFNNLITRRMQVVNLSPWLLYPWERNCWYPLNRRVG
jgi:hypothetical protein